jgi:hypothetical protein
MLRVRTTRGSGFRRVTDRFTDKGAFFVRFRPVFGESMLTPPFRTSTVRRMTDDRKSGLALIAGSVGMIVTMVVHPHGMVSAAQVESMARNLTAVHSLAVASLPLIVLGVLGLSQRLKGPDRLALAALVLFAFATVAVMNAAVMDGLVAPNVMRRMAEAGASARESWGLVFRYNFEVNQANARLYAVASSLALVLWSIAIVRTGALARGVGIYGCILGAVTVVAVASGKLRPDVHGFGAVILGQGGWFVIVGALLWRWRETPRPAQME